MKLIQVFMIINCLSLYSQQIFTMNKDTFFIYDLYSKQIVKIFEYNDIGAILWRPNYDASLIFYKKNFDDSSIICYNPVTMTEQEIESYYPFTDFQVISHNELAIRAGEKLYLWNIEENHYKLVAGRVSGTYFFYNTKYRLLITQTKRNSIELWDDHATRRIVATNIKGSFSATQDSLFYVTDERSFVHYNFSSMEKNYYHIKHRSDHIDALWGVSANQYLIKLGNPRSFSYISLNIDDQSESDHPILSYSSNLGSLLPQIVANDLLQIVTVGK